jgi:hypothetical protein
MYYNTKKPQSVWASGVPYTVLCESGDECFIAIVEFA